MIKLVTCVAIAASALVVSAQDYSGVGTISVLATKNEQYGTPADKVGCLAADGSFLNPIKDSDCGVFTVRKDFPYTMSSTAGNCTFDDPTQPTNTDSVYGKSDHAFHCFAGYQSQAGDALYTISGFTIPLLCSGDADCFYDAKKVPAKGEKTSLWPYRWGSQQIGITPGHVELQLLWNKTQ